MQVRAYCNSSESKSREVRLWIQKSHYGWEHKTGRSCFLFEKRYVPSPFPLWESQVKVAGKLWTNSSAGNHYWKGAELQVATLLPATNFLAEPVKERWEALNNSKGWQPLLEMGRATGWQAYSLYPTLPSRAWWRILRLPKQHSKKKVPYLSTC